MYTLLGLWINGCSGFEELLLYRSLAKASAKAQEPCTPKSCWFIKESLAKDNYSILRLAEL